MKKHNVRVTRPEQDRATAAIARRAKRKSARDAIIAPYLKLLSKANEEKLQLLKNIAEMHRAAATQPGPTELAARQVEGSSDAPTV